MDAKTLQFVSVKDIAANPYNPRMHFNEEEMSLLRESIRKVGILVPVTVYLNTKKHPKEKYILLDGERRWRCCQSLNIEQIQCNVIDEPEDITQNILYMFNIHHFRTEWDLFPTALKLELIADKIGTDNEASLSEFTGLTRSYVRRCKMLLWYPEKYRNELANKNPSISTDFLIELYPIASKICYLQEFVSTMKIDDFIDKIVLKYKNNEDFSIKDLREIRKSFGFAVEKNKTVEFISNLSDFLETNVGFEVFTNEDIEDERNRRLLLKNISALNENIKKINPEVVSDMMFVDLLNELQDNVKTLISKIE